MLHLYRDIFKLSPLWSTFAPLWVKCDECGEFRCRFHHLHVSECPCPPVKEWTLSPHSH